MTLPRTTKPKGVLLNLPVEQQAQLAEWLLSGMPYHVARETIAKAPPDGFGVTLRSLSSFTKFWEVVCVTHLLRRRQRSVDTAKQVAEEAKANPGQFDAATIDALKQAAFDMASSPQCNPKDVKAIFSLVLKARAQDQTSEQMNLEREKFRETIKTNIEKALDAFYEEIKNNASALQIFQQLRAVMVKQVKEAK